MEININHISFQYPNGYPALRDVHLNIPSEQHIALIGHNGCGKTTLARCIKGLLHPTNGEILLDGKSIRNEKISSLAHKVGFVFQHPDDQIFHQTVYQEVAFGPKNLGMSGEVQVEKIKEALALTGLENEKTTHPYDLSLSARKRIAIASTLAMDTDIIIFDEPTAGMDHKELTLMEVIFQELRNKKKTIITISHDMDLVLEQSDQLAIMAAGQIVKVGDPVILFRDMEENFSEMVAPQMVRLSQRVLKNNKTAKTVDQFVDFLIQ
jgi:energy-coupling factor transport system ATP-binding protein